MASVWDPSTSGRLPGKEHVVDDDVIDTGEYFDGDSIFEEEQSKSGTDYEAGINDDAGKNGDEASATGDTNNDVGVGANDDYPTAVIVVETLADEADD